MSATTPAVPTLADILAVIEMASEKFNKDLDKSREEYDRRMKEEAAKRDASAAEFDRRLKEEAAKREAEAAKREEERKAEAALRAVESAKREAEATKRAEELAAWQKEWREQSGHLNKKLGTLDHNIGEFSENMIINGLVKKFEELGHETTGQAPHRKFRSSKSKDVAGEIDFLYESTDTIILLEIKTTLEVEDVKEHIERLEKYRQYVEDEEESKKTKSIIGAVHGALVKGGAREFALNKGLYVVEHSGDSIQIVKSDKREVRKW